MSGTEQRYVPPFTGGGGGSVTSVTGTGQIDVDNTDPTTPVVKTFNQTTGNDSELVESVVAGTNITVDNTDPKNPVVNASGGGGGSSPFTENIQTGSYTFVLTDADNGLVVVVLNAAAASTFTIPQFSSVAWPQGSVINLLTVGAGVLTIAAGTGVTLQSPFSKVQLATQYARATLINRVSASGGGNSVWSLEGNLA